MITLNEEKLAFLDITGTENGEGRYADDVAGWTIEVSSESNKARVTVDGGSTWYEVEIGRHRIDPPTRL